MLYYKYYIVILLENSISLKHISIKNIEVKGIKCS